MCLGKIVTCHYSESELSPWVEPVQEFQVGDYVAHYGRFAVISKSLGDNRYLLLSSFPDTNGKTVCGGSLVKCRIKDGYEIDLAPIGDYSLANLQSDVDKIRRKCRQDSEDLCGRINAVEKQNAELRERLGKIEKVSVLTGIDVLGAITQFEPIGNAANAVKP